MTAADEPWIHVKEFTCGEETRVDMSIATRVKILIGAPCALALAGTIAACGSTAGGSGALPTIFTPAAHPAASLIEGPTDSQLRAYLRVHRAPPRPGMTAGIRSYSALSRAEDIRCGGGRGSAAIVGNAGDCLAWQVTLVTATGTLTVTCGNLSTAVSCQSAVYSDRSQYPLPDPGDYVYAPRDGQVTAAHDMIIIKRNAIS